MLQKGDEAYLDGRAHAWDDHLDSVRSEGEAYQEARRCLAARKSFAGEDGLA